MKETNANGLAANRPAPNASVPDAAQHDPAMVTAAAQSMTSAIARLPRAMSWSVQPVTVMRVSAGSGRAAN